MREATIRFLGLDQQHALERALAEVREAWAARYGLDAWQLFQARKRHEALIRE